MVVAVVVNNLPLEAAVVEDMVDRNPLLLFWVVVALDMVVDVGMVVEVVVAVGDNMNHLLLVVDAVGDVVVDVVVDGDTPLDMNHPHSLVEDASTQLYIYPHLPLALVVEGGDCNLVVV